MDKHAHLSRALCALVLTLALTAPACAEEAVPAVPAETVEPSLTDRLRTAVQWPDTFLITYAVENRDGTVSLLSYGRDSAGRYHVANEDEEALYVPEATY